MSVYTGVRGYFRTFTGLRKMAQVISTYSKPDITRQFTIGQILPDLTLFMQCL